MAVGMREYKYEHTLVDMEVVVQQELELLVDLEDHLVLLDRHPREVLDDQRVLEVLVDHYFPLVLQEHRIVQDPLPVRLVQGDQVDPWDHQALEVQENPLIHQHQEDQEVEVEEMGQEDGAVVVEEDVGDNKRENTQEHSDLHSPHHKDVE